MGLAEGSYLFFDLVQFRDELLDFLPGFLRLAARLGAQKFRDIADIEQPLGGEHEALFDLGIDRGHRTWHGDRGREHAGERVIIARADRIELMVVAAAQATVRPRTPRETTSTRSSQSSM